MTILEKLYSRFLDRAYPNQKISYSQCGEDLIVDFLLTWELGIKTPSFLDVGAHHPFWLNNTYIFYKRGLTGINIEPDPSLFATLSKHRPKDININKGVGINKTNEMADFYIMSSRSLNTFSRSEAEATTKLGSNKIEEIKQIELININDILLKYFPGKSLDFLSIDIEGFDLPVLHTIDYKSYAPKIICVETSAFVENHIASKQQPTIDLLLDHGYRAYADTFY